VKISVLQGGIGNVLIQANYYLHRYGEAKKYCYFISGSAQRNNVLRIELEKHNFFFLSKYIYKLSRFMSKVTTFVTIKDEYYFEAIPEMSEDFCFFNLVNQEEDLIQRAAIHIRGQDYLDEKNVNYNVCGQKYYRNAIEYLQKEGLNKFYVVSDDAVYSRKILEPLIAELNIDLRYVNKENTQEDDFKFLALSKFCIIPNSTFSLTASFHRIGRKVILAPRTWSRENLINPRLPQCIIKI
jgi:hypothetical protein